MKNNTQPDSPFYDRVVHSNGLLRVMESVRGAEGNDAAGALYTVYGEHIHDSEDMVGASVALAEAGLDGSHGAAFDDDSWDPAIKTAMDEGLALTGTDVGTPLLGFDNLDGRRVGFFGPVISRRLTLDVGLRLWDGLMLTASTDAFWELKRTRTESPDSAPPADR